MKIKRKKRELTPFSSLKPQASNPRGSTLTEVLFSILALAIGLAMVFTLFPASILRSINATRLTRGTIHRYNAEAWIDVFTDQLVHNPDRSALARRRKHYDQANPAASGGYTGNNYIVDPIGWERIRFDNRSSASNGRNEANFFGAGTFGTGRLQRYNGLNTRTARLSANAGTLGGGLFDQARMIATSPDNWTEPLKREFVTSNLTPTSIDISGPSAGDMVALQQQLTGSNAPLTRIVILDATGKFSHVRAISSINPGPSGGPHTINWTAGGALPAAAVFTPATARIRTQERFFTWMLTVRNRSEARGTVAQNIDVKKANVDVVVFFRRQYSTNYENRAWTFVRQGNRRYRVEAEAGGPLPITSPRPFLKKGAWLCDTINARWYRIQRLEGETTATPHITLERDLPLGQALTKGVILPTVVEVYPLGTKS